MDWADRIFKGESSQISAKLRRGDGRYFHWCPGCEATHQLPDGAGFDGDVAAPTFASNLLHNDDYPKRRCHYALTGGVLNYRLDCHHALAGKVILLPDLPLQLQDMDLSKGQNSFASPSDDKNPYITSAREMSGWFAVLMWWHSEKGGFWAPWRTGRGSYATQAEAEAEAREWAEAEEITFRTGVAT